MSKLNRLGAVLFMVALVGVAWGGATKISSFMIEADFIGCPSGDGVDIEMADAADGMAILNYVPGTDTTIVQVIVSDFTGAPEQRFIVRLDPDPSLDPDPCDPVPCDLGTFLVDSQGNGHFHGEIGGNHSGSNVELWQQPDPPPCLAVRIAYGQ